MPTQIPAVAIIGAVFAGLVILLPQIANFIILLRTHRAVVKDAKVNVDDAAVNRDTRTFVDGAHTKSLRQIADLSTQVAELDPSPAARALATKAEEDATPSPAAQPHQPPPADDDEGEDELG